MNREGKSAPPYRTTDFSIDWQESPVDPPSPSRQRRAKERRERVRKLREKSSIDNGSSPSPVRLENEVEDHTDGEMADDLKKFMEQVNSKLDKLDKMPTKEQFEKFNSRIEENSEQILIHDRRLKEQDTKIARLTASVEKIERDQVDARRGLDGRVKAMMGAAGCGVNGLGGDERSFEIARRMLCIWPIDGSNEEEMKHGVAEFIKNALDVRDFEKQVGALGNVRRIQDKERSVIFKEVTVEFADKKTRDFIASRGSKLAPFMDGNNRPTCGMRMSVPEHLEPAFRLLKRYGFHLKDTRNKGTRSNVRFDDYKKSLFLQVKFPDETEWLHISPDEAHEALRSHDSRRNARVRSMNSPGRSPKRRRRRSSGQAAGAAMELDKDEEVTIIQRSTWKPPSRA